MTVQKNILTRSHAGILDTRPGGTIRSRLTGVGHATNQRGHFTIAHIADPHVNQQLHPERLQTLRSLIVNAIERGAAHIVISGDIASVPVAEHWIAVREMLRELGIYRRDMVSLVVGNHDVFGGPHSTSDLLTFQLTCKRTNTKANIEHFVEVFSELFRDTIHPKDSAFPYIKVVGDNAFIGVNSVAPFTLKHNPCASNGEISVADMKWLNEELPRFAAYHKIAIVHHHFVNHKACFLRRTQYARRVLNWIEAKSLKMRNEFMLFELLSRFSVEAVLHGHVHVSTSYDMGTLACSNAGGSVIPSKGSLQPSYNYLVRKSGAFRIQIVEPATDLQLA